MASIKDRKEQLRKQFQANRLKLSSEARRVQSAAVCDSIRAMPELQETATVHLYWPLLDRGELDTRPLIDHLSERGHQIALPKIDLSTSRKTGVPSMTHLLYSGKHNLAKNEWGVMEPQNAQQLSDDDIDAVVVPAFGAGRNRHRIGHGHGYYDAFLSRLSALTICPVFENCLVDEVPAEPHDVPLDVVVTPSEKIMVTA